MDAKLGIRKGAGVGFSVLALYLIGTASSFAVNGPAVPESKPDTVRVTITANAVTAMPDSVRPGEVTLQVTNSSSKVQDFEVDGPHPNGEPDVELDDLAPGERRNLTIALRAGDYRIEAEEDDGNNERSMVLTVR